MLGLLNRKILKSMAMNLYHELVRGRIYEGKHFGLNADDISQRTGLSIHVAIALIHRLIDNELVEKPQMLISKNKTRKVGGVT
ncbi:hypothetical protein J7925_15885 [Vibrio parahaemolyticus]|nr:hypothetical protein [Vibrio parahaemolyticus]